MNYTHLTIDERAVIYQLFQGGSSIRFIADAIGRSPSTISRELKRNFCGYKHKYLPHIAQKKYCLRRQVCHRKSTASKEVIEYLTLKLKNETWSPEQIYNYQKEVSPSTSTIYRWIH
jgi:IS30 family transposase